VEEYKREEDEGCRCVEEESVDEGSVDEAEEVVDE
jgi:hypothetical protein